MNKKRRAWPLVTGIALALATPTVIAVAAGLPNVFSAGQVISSQQVNANFTALDQRLAALEAAAVPPRTVVGAHLTPSAVASLFTAGRGNAGTVYAGWALCDGQNGTPALSGTFPRWNVTGVGPTGGNDTLSEHNHLMPMGFDGGSVFADLALVSDSLVYSTTGAGVALGASSTRNVRTQYTRPGGSADNRPAFIELVCLMKL